MGALGSLVGAGCGISYSAKRQAGVTGFWGDVRSRPQLWFWGLSPRRFCREWTVSVFRFALMARLILRHSCMHSTAGTVPIGDSPLAGAAFGLEEGELARTAPAAQSGRHGRIRTCNLLVRSEAGSPVSPHACGERGGIRTRDLLIDSEAG